MPAKKTRVDFYLPGEEVESSWTVSWDEDEMWLEGTDLNIGSGGNHRTIATFPLCSAIRLVDLGSKELQYGTAVFPTYDQALDNAKLRAEVEHETACKIAAWIRKQEGPYLISNLLERLLAGEYR